MGPVQVSVDIPQAIEQVWEEAGALGRHAEWMADARSIEVLDPGPFGVGTRLRVATRLGPLRTIDILTVTLWEPPRSITVEHGGRFRGWGRFRLEPLGPTLTRFTWEESIRFPWYLGGPLGTLAARPIFTRVWRRNLARFRARFTPP